MARQAVFQTEGRRAVQSPAATEGNPVVIENREHSSDNFKNYVLWGIIGTAAAGTLVYFGWKLITDKISDRENKGSLDNEDPAYYAKQFKIGFDNNNWYGSDTETVRETMLAIPSKDFFEKVAQSYQRQYKSSLYKDLEAKLKSTEYQEMQAIYKVKPQKTGGSNAAPIYDPYAWATRIHAAVNYETWGVAWGTDEEAIKQVIREIPNQSAWNDLKAAYESKYSLDIGEEIDGDLDSDEYDFRDELQKKNITA
jgi:hypothetical protein